jgi:hypothetical protein
MSIWQKPPLGALPLSGHPLSQGLVGAWLMNEGAGSKVYDLSGYGNTGTFQGTAPSWKAGQYGSVVSLPGTDEYINVPNSSSLDITGSQITLSLHFKPKFTDAIAYEQLLIDKTTGNNQAFRLMWLDSITSFRFRLFTTSGTVNCDVLFTGWDADETYHLAATYDGTTMSVYWDGVLKQTAAQTGTITSSSDPVVLGWNSNGVTYVIADYETASIYNRALTASEIAQLYLEPFCMFDYDPIELWVGAGAPPAGGAGIMTTNTGFWGATY